MRVVFPAAAVALVLAACAHPTRHAVVQSGEVALAPTATAAASRGATFAPIAVAELLTSSAASVRTAVSTRSLAPSATAASRAGDVELWRGTYVGRTYGQRGALALAFRPEPNGTVRGVVAWRVSPARSEAFRTV